ncbi:hypothetical protein CERSUDRAFT_113810 [Gelatoporia subvermispora B]|uniref:Uncharacterized protein n=1 Tax=Ceriporiopsis subvermispora (strain B) TaxID=914234 RepID=M2RIJ9_CERS8|nr:hypothetical protein CERSUDRAFT_113810 [Gelatoporia subvermispora B]
MPVSVHISRRHYLLAANQSICNMRPQTKLYVHPDLKADDEDLTLFSTICFVLGMAIMGAIIVLSVSCLIFWDDCKASYAYYGARPHFLSVQQAISRG